MRCSRIYLEEMRKSLTYKEKLWFLNEINITQYDFIIDFGCATGAILSCIDQLLPHDSETFLCGVDSMSYPEDEYPHFEHKCVFVHNLVDITPKALKGSKVLLILSSVMHELSFEDCVLLKKWIKEYVTTIVCRDMFHPDATEYGNQNKEIELLMRISNSSEGNDKLQAISSNYKNHQHKFWMTKLVYEYLLKYTYEENWDTEVKEIYLNNNAFDLCMSLGGYNEYVPFRIKEFKTYILPYKKKEIKKRFGYRLRFPTHIKFILERNKGEEV